MTKKTGQSNNFVNQVRGYLAIYSESSVRMNIIESCLYQSLPIPTPPQQEDYKVKGPVKIIFTGPLTL